ncbi:MAG: PstS family phosphate transporter substrate-binding protein [Bacillales bacterium]|jgi:phosphate transport system substrate-binding protein|nr:PstS family phosphate transporter substrate-binding protein [Bacillales bacterium]
MKKIKVLSFLLIITSLLVFTAACGDKKEENKGSEEKLSGEVISDGSSTVFPIMEAVSEEYALVQPDVQAPVGSSGTGGGFKKFVKGETDISNASREIKEEEATLAKEGGVEYLELELAYDGLTVAVSKENDWAKDITIDELKKLWIEDGTVKKWSDIRPEWPKEEVKFYSPGTDSGTYDYFNEIVLEDQQMNKKTTLSEDDNVLVSGVAGDKYSIGFFGYAYYAENKDKLTSLKINGVEPTNETIESGKYTPLSRPLFIYVNKASLKDKPQVRDYVKFTLENAGELAEEVGYVKLPDEKYTEQLELIK